MKTFLSILLTITILMSAITIPVSADDNIKVVLNGEELVFDVPPQIIDDRTMVPMRVIFEALGADVYFIDEGENQYYKEIIAVKNDIKLFLPISGMVFVGNKMVKECCANFDEYYLSSANYNPEKYIKLDVTPQIIDGRTLVPLRAVSESLGVSVEWDGNSNTVFLVCDKNFIADKNKDKAFFDNYLRYKTEPSVNPGNGEEDNTVPQIDESLPAEIQDLAKEIYNVKNGGEAIVKIIEKFGEPEDEGVQGFPVPVWKLDNGKITFWTFYGVVYENDEGFWFLTKRKARFGDVLNCMLQIHSLVEGNSSMGIGEVFLKSDNTYVYDYPWQADKQLSDSQKEAFFINNRVGTWEIKFEEGYSYDTDITKLDHDTEIKKFYPYVGAKETKIAEIIFTGQNGETVAAIINVPLFPANITFNSDALKCTINPHIIKSPFTMGYI